MSFQGMMERIRLERLPEGTRCVCVLIIGTTRYEQDRQSLRLDFRTTFPDRSLDHEQICEEWADRVIQL